MTESITQIRLNMLLTELSKLFIPLNQVATFHIKDCHKGELMDIGAKLNLPLIQPEDNLFADSYSIKIIHSDKATIYMHSNGLDREPKALPPSDKLKMAAFIEELSKFCSPDVASAKMRECVDVVMANLRDNAGWLKEELSKIPD